MSGTVAAFLESAVALSFHMVKACVCLFVVVFLSAKTLAILRGSATTTPLHRRYVHLLNLGKEAALEPAVSSIH